MAFPLYNDFDLFGQTTKKNKSVEHKRQPITISQKNMVWDRQNGICAFCKHTLKKSSTHYDHIKEVSKGGKTVTNNLRALCANCHSERHNKDKAKRADKVRKNQSTKRGVNKGTDILKEIKNQDNRFFSEAKRSGLI